MADDLSIPLLDLDTQFDDSFGWWANIWDPQSGGAFYGLSGKQARSDGDLSYGPDIEATQKLVKLCNDTGLLKGDNLQTFKFKIIAYIQSLQDPESGFFKDPQPILEPNPKILPRGLSMAQAILEQCGGAPLYPLPMDRINENKEAASFYAHLQNAEAFKAWLDQQPWDDRIWTAGSNLLSQNNLFSDLDPDLRQERLETLKLFLLAQQQSNGYLGINAPQDAWYSKLSGTYKAMNFMVQQGLSIPNGERCKATVFQDINRPYDNAIWLYNTVNILCILDANGFPLSDEEKRFLLTRSTEILKDFRAPDGGFTTYKNRSAPNQMSRRLGKDVVEGNTNASGLMYKTRNLLYMLVLETEVPPPHPGTQELKRLLEAQ